MNWKDFDTLGEELEDAFPGFRVQMDELEEDEIIKVKVGKFPPVITSMKCSKELVYETVANRILEFKRSPGPVFANSKNPVKI